MSLNDNIILITFNGVALDPLNGVEDKFCESITKVAKQSKLFRFSNIKVSLAEAKIGAFPEYTKIAVLLPNLNEGNNVNAGEQVYDFKKSLIPIIKNFGIQVDPQGVVAKLCKPSDIANISLKARKINTEPRAVSGAMEHNNSQRQSDSEEFDYEQKSKQYIAVDPLYSFNRVILPEGVVEKIEEAIAILECENKVFKEWGLYEIQPHPSTSLSFFGPSGTGKTMAAEAVAEKLGKKILKVSYTDVESKYHGEGPKMIKAIFVAAKNADAVLFFDEADSLLSKRLTNVSEGSAQAINSMRSQLLISLEEFRGIVIFATNLVINYDQAFLTRLISVEFPLPDLETRKKIWDVHIKAPNDGLKHQLNIPLADDVDTRALAEQFEFVGREIRNAVIGACVRAAMNGKDILTQADFINACENIRKEREALASAKDHTRDSTATQEFLKAAIAEKMKKADSIEKDSERNN